MKPFISILAFVFAIIFLANYSHAGRFVPSSSDIISTYRYFFDAPFFLLVFVPVFVFTICFKPKESFSFQSEHWANHFSKCSTFSQMFGLVIFVVLLCWFSADMRPETIGPNMSMLLLPVLYSLIFSLTFFIFKSNCSSKP